MPLFRRIPKRGFSHATWDKHFHVVNVGDLDNAFDDGDTVDQETLRKSRAGQGTGRWRTHPRQRRADQEADREGAPLLEVGRREDRRPRAARPR